MSALTSLVPVVTSWYMCHRWDSREVQQGQTPSGPGTMCPMSNALLPQPEGKKSRAQEHLAEILKPHLPPQLKDTYFPSCFYLSRGVMSCLRLTNQAQYSLKKVKTSFPFSTVSGVTFSLTPREQQILHDPWKEQQSQESSSLQTNIACSRSQKPADTSDPRG